MERTVVAGRATFKVSQIPFGHLDLGLSPTAGGGGLGRLRSSPPSPSSSTPRRSRGVLELGQGVLELKLHEEESNYTKAFLR